MCKNKELTEKEMIDFLKEENKLLLNQLDEMSKFIDDLAKKFEVLEEEKKEIFKQMIDFQNEQKKQMKELDKQISTLLK